MVFIPEGFNFFFASQNVGQVDFVDPDGGNPGIPEHGLGAAPLLNLRGLLGQALGEGAQIPRRQIGQNQQRAHMSGEELCGEILQHQAVGGNRRIVNPKAILVHRKNDGFATHEQGSEFQQSLLDGGFQRRMGGRVETGGLQQDIQPAQGRFEIFRCQCATGQGSRHSCFEGIGVLASIVICTSIVNGQRRLRSAEVAVASGLGGSTTQKAWLRCAMLSV